jgi:hypothetical protein
LGQTERQDFTFFRIMNAWYVQQHTCILFLMFPMDIELTGSDDFTVKVNTLLPFLASYRLRRVVSVAGISGITGIGKLYFKTVPTVSPAAPWTTTKRWTTPAVTLPRT